jgi:hypothetical protein
MKQFCLSILVLILSFSVFAGNGVERGSVMIKTNSDVNSEITDYLSKKLDSCLDVGARTEGYTFVVDDVLLNRVRVDQGIVDLYYHFEGNIVSGNKVILENVRVEILDSDFHNWRNYEEKLSVESISSNINNCQ